MVTKHKIELFKEKAGVISENECWVIFDGNYMYANDSLLGVLYQYTFEFEHNKHFVGF